MAEPFIPLMRTLMDEREAGAATRVILSGWVTQGPEVARFEQEFAETVGALHACAVANCTTALHLSLLAAGVQPDDEVVTVSHSYIATANAIRYCGALPVFVDIEPDTFNLNPALLEAAITPHTRAVLCVHQIGMPCHLRAILEIARRRNLPVIEDAACAIGSEIRWDDKWERIGKPHADVACFSFHPRKLISTGDGGMITTRHAAWDLQFRLWRQHGMSVPDVVRHKSAQVVFESYPVVGYNYRMTDIQAAVGREQLKRLPHIVERRRTLAEQYRELLRDVTEVQAPSEPDYARTNWQSYCVRLPRHCDQRAVMQQMLDRGIATRRGIMCAHRELAYSKSGFWKGGPLRVSEDAQDHTILLPLFDQMTDDQQHRIIVALDESVRSCSAT